MAVSRTNQERIDKAFANITYNAEDKIDEQVQYFGNVPSNEYAFDSAHNTKKNTILRNCTFALTALTILSLALLVKEGNFLTYMLAGALAIAASLAHIESSGRKRARRYWKAMAGDDDDKAIAAFYRSHIPTVVSFEITHKLQSVVANVSCKLTDKITVTRTIDLQTDNIEETLKDIDYLTEKTRQSEQRIKETFKTIQMRRMEGPRKTIQEMQKGKDEVLPESKDIAKTLDAYAKDLQRQVRHIDIEQKMAVENSSTATATNS